MSHLFTSGGQSIGVSASASVLPMNTQDWFPLGWCWEVAKFSKRFENRESWNCYCFRFCIFLNIPSKFTLDSDCFFSPNMLGIALYFVFSASVKKKILSLSKGSLQNLTWAQTMTRPLPQHRFPPFWMLIIQYPLSNNCTPISCTEFNSVLFILVYHC